MKVIPRMKTPALPTASHRVTNEVIFSLIEKNITPDSQILDLGSGSGHMTRRIFNWLQEHGQNSSGKITASDINRDAFKATEIDFVESDFGNKLPFDDHSFDLVFSVEVIEHLTNPYDFIEECKRVLKPGGTLILSTPNINNLQSKLRYLLTGMHALYEAPSVKPENAGRLCGHIMPLGLVYIAYAFRRAGLLNIQIHGDKPKKSSVILYFALYPILKMAQSWQTSHSLRYDISTFEENKELMASNSSFSSLTSRSTILEAQTPRA